MQIIIAFQRLEKWVFDFPQRVELNIHHSLTSRPLLLIIRLLAFLILSFRYYLSILTYASPFNILEYLTELSFAITWIYFALTLEDYLINELPKERKSKSLRQWVNLLFETTLCLQLIVSALFWSVLYDYTKPFEVVAFLKEFGVHGFPFVCLLLDFSLNVYQFPKRHLPLVIGFGLSYLFLNIVYSLIVEPIYKPLDWISVMCYVYVISSILLTFAFHTLLRKFWQKYRRPFLEKLADPTGYQNMVSEAITN